MSRKERKGSRSAIGVDLATGKPTDFFYFDPEKCLEKVEDEEWFDQHLFVPAGLVEHDDEKAEALLRLPSNDVVRVRSTGMRKVDQQEMEGVPDILQLNNFSEMSLILTLRTRYDEVGVVGLGFRLVQR